MMKPTLNKIFLRSFSTVASTTQTNGFSKILIANRGEIACRVMRTAKSKGIKTVAVYSDADKQSLHVEMADEARLIGPPPAKESYLVAEKIIKVAKETGAEAIHPGYGFLSENAEFAELVEKSGLTFVGPPASAIRSMGSKSASKDIMIQAGVPTVPGYHGTDQTLEGLKKEADKIGYPVLIKAVLGGGGKGMKIVENPADLEENILSAIREAQSSFGDSRVLIEKYLRNPRHVEVQVFGDKHGNYVYLFERDCSVQRRHQKVIEEAPAPGLSTELREKLGSTAVAAARAVGYVGAGTVEFIMDTDGTFYFMEMNTRLQVEHPITEMITGQDLVAWQLMVAAGHPLPLTQSQLKLNGHAFEARIYAENPQREFLPGTGKLELLRTPLPEDGHVRIETGVREGDEVSVYYDPMIAKLVVWDTDRVTALKRLERCLEQYHIVGLHTNVSFLKKLATHPAFIRGEVETGFIPKYRHELLDLGVTPSEQSLALTVLGILLQEKNSFSNQFTTKSDPWLQSNGARLNHQKQRTVSLLLDDGSGSDKPKEVKLEVTYLKDRSYEILLPSSNTKVRLEGKLKESGLFNAFVGDKFYPSVRIAQHKDTLNVFYDGTSFTVGIPNTLGNLGGDKGHGSLLSPMPGKIIKVNVKKGDTVKKGQPLLIMEAMKMEHIIRSPTEGIVQSITYTVGEIVEEKKVFVVIAEPQPQK
eukprot:TRINITY_DN8405_c0_g1_i1.p1 TRINITY_DN8405_c0_g1~~TRINITY_DN8405_c0_g1_i1.p1  ORF type:complete len:702 (-),score=169.60 TRINITY_DN8405_c0_g1_i1:141-2246(-)